MLPALLSLYLPVGYPSNFDCRREERLRFQLQTKRGIKFSVLLLFKAVVALLSPVCFYPLGRLLVFYNRCCSAFPPPVFLSCGHDHVSYRRC